MTDIFTSEKRSRIMSKIGGKDTAPEIAVRKLLHGMGYRFRVHKGSMPGNPDLVLPKYKTVIFIHGCFWHGHACNRGKRPSTNTEFWNRKISRNIRRDRSNARKLRSQGWRVVTVWQCRLKNMDKVKNRLQRILERHGASL